MGSLIMPVHCLDPQVAEDPPSRDASSRPRPIIAQHSARAPPRRRARARWAAHMHVHSMRAARALYFYISALWPQTLKRENLSIDAGETAGVLGGWVLARMPTGHSLQQGLPPATKCTTRRGSCTRACGAAARLEREAGDTSPDLYLGGSLSWGSVSALAATRGCKTFFNCASPLMCF